MKSNFLTACSIGFLISFNSIAQTIETKLSTTQSPDLFFISDTQQPMMLEKILHKPNNNIKATSLLLDEIVHKNPGNLYMLGDVVGLGKSSRKWKRIDQFLDTCRKQGTKVCGLLGNHEVMFNKHKGQRNFDKRFPMNVNTGYVSVADSVAVVLLNSNFKSLSASERNKQKEWYEATLKSLDATDSVLAVIVTCHHAPFSNSKVVSCSERVQENFVPAYLQSQKAQLFITGHAHAYEHFKKMGKDFLVIGGGGGLHQPLNASDNALLDEAAAYKPMFHYLSVKREVDGLLITSYFLNDNFSGFSTGQSFEINPKNKKTSNFVAR